MKWYEAKVTGITRAWFVLYGASTFNRDGSNRYVAKDTDMTYMVYGASNLNGDLGKWYVAKGTDMRARSKSRFSKLEGESPTVSPHPPEPGERGRGGV